MIHYMNKTTGEVTIQKDRAMMWYREGHEVALMDYSDVCGWVERGYWAH